MIAVDYVARVRGPDGGCEPGHALRGVRHRQRRRYGAASALRRDHPTLWDCSGRKPHGSRRGHPDRLDGGRRPGGCRTTRDGHARPPPDPPRVVGQIVWFAIASSRIVQVVRAWQPARVEPLAGPVPVDRDDVTGAGSSTKPSPSCQPRTVSSARRPEPELAIDHSSGTASTSSSPPIRSRTVPQRIRQLIDDAEDVVGRPAPQQPDDREDIEDVECVDRMGAVGCLGRRASARPMRGRAAGTASRSNVRSPPSGRRPAGRYQASTPPRRGRRAGRRCRSSGRSARDTATRPRSPGPARGSVAGRRRRRPRRAARRRRPGRSSRADSARRRSARSGSDPGRRTAIVGSSRDGRDGGPASTSSSRRWPMAAEPRRPRRPTHRDDPGRRRPAGPGACR